MAFDNVYPNRKDWRKPYYDSRRFDYTCRHQGSCEYCSNNRQFNSKKREPIVLKEELLPLKLCR